MCSRWVFVVLLHIFLHENFTNAGVGISPRIIGGSPVEDQSSLYHVSIQDDYGNLCGGSIIHKDYILTAAHCLDHATPEELIVRAGSIFANKGGQLERVCEGVKHENYQEALFDYDIAIFKLCNSLNVSDIELAVLPEYDESIEESTLAMVRGWGRTLKSENSLQLQETQVLISNITACQERYKTKDLEISSRMLCAVCPKGVCDACQGDSGGPLIANGKQVGIVSWGFACGSQTYPGVYTRVAKFRKWIKNKIGI